VIRGEDAAIASDANDVSADERIDAAPNVVLGGVDVHTHFREPDPNLVAA
jgi:dihydroorotase-like cyclic amidohydrolase